LTFTKGHWDETTASLTDNAPYHNARAGGEESERSIPELRSAAALDPAARSNNGFKERSNGKTSSAQADMRDAFDKHFYAKEV
jgi:hypothetical protein